MIKMEAEVVELIDAATQDLCPYGPNIGWAGPLYIKWVQLNHFLGRSAGKDTSKIGHEAKRGHFDIAPASN